MSETTPHDTFARLLAEYRWANNAIGVAEGDDAKDVAEVQRIGQKLEQLYADMVVRAESAERKVDKCRAIAMRMRTGGAVVYSNMILEVAQ